jgi:hypothetical protein
MGVNSLAAAKRYPPRLPRHAACPRRFPGAEGYTGRLNLPQQVRQLGDVGGDPARFIDIPAAATFRAVCRNDTFVT